MGIAYEVVAGRVTNPGATPTALTANTGDSFTVKNFPMESGAWLEGIWAKAGTSGVIQVRSSKLHDFTQGLRLRHQANEPRNLLPDEAMQRLHPQDNLTVEVSGSAAATDVGLLALYYRDLPGQDQRLAMWEQIQPRILHITAVEVSITAAGTLGDWSAGTAIDATNDLLKANTDYAVLGYHPQNEVAGIALRGPDTGNLRIGGPGSVEPIETRNWFVDQTRLKNTPHIPVINAANKGGTLAFQVDNAAGAANLVDFILAELSPA